MFLETRSCLYNFNYPTHWQLGQDTTQRTSFHGVSSKFLPPAGYGNCCCGRLAESEGGHYKLQLSRTSPPGALNSASQGTHSNPLKSAPVHDLAQNGQNGAPEATFHVVLRGLTFSSFLALELGVQKGWGVRVASRKLLLGDVG